MERGNRWNLGDAESLPANANDRQALAERLLREGNAELARLRMTRGAYKRTARRIRRVLVIVAVAASLLGAALGTSALAATPVFRALTNPFDLGDAGRYAKPTFGDLDGDGDLDALVGNDASDLFFFENTGTDAAAAFARGISSPFGLALPGGVGWESTAPAFVDIDGDGDLDLFVGSYRGDTTFFENIGTTAVAAFAAVDINPFGLERIGSSTAPTFADVDGDGDLDLFAGEGDGDTVFFENTGGLGAPLFAAPVSNPFGLDNVGGAAVPAFADAEADGDLDAFIGSAGGETVFFRNVGSAGRPTFVLAAVDPFGLVPVDDYAAPAFADVDADGDLDLVVGSRTGNAWFFENATAAPPAPPAFGDAGVNPFGLADVGTNASPALADIDHDGDLDAFFGNAAGDWSFARNVGSPSSAVFTGVAKNPFGLTNQGSHSTPALVDIDADGDLDAFTGRDAFSEVGTLLFFENTGTPSAPGFAPAVSNPFGTTAFSANARPTFGDLDDDGDLDLLIGDLEGRTRFLENTGTASAPAFAPHVRDPFGLADVGSRATPVLTDVDLDGDLDVLIGSESGDTYFFENTGTRTAAAFAAPVVDPFGIGPVASAATPAFGDLDFDGDQDLLVGIGNGNTRLFERLGTAFVTFEPHDVPRLALGGDGVQSVDLVDFDGDLDLDLFAGSGNDILYFENTGTRVSPAFGPPSANPFGLTAVDSTAYPILVDIDDDGDLDAIVAKQRGGPTFFRNTGSMAAPAFVPAGLGSLLGHRRLTAADIDNDGDFDLLGQIGILNENIGTRSAPAFQSVGQIASSSGQTDLGVTRAADVDGDTDLDLFITGDTDLWFVQNTGTPSAYAFDASSRNPFGLTTAPGADQTPFPALADIDADGDLDLFVARLGGEVFFYENFAAAPCPPAPDPACTSGFEKGQLVVKEKKPGAEKIVAKLAKGPALGQADFGDPTAPDGTGYALCLYGDQDDLAATLEVDRGGEDCGAKPCWKSLGGASPNGKGHLYKDKRATSSGVVQLKLKGGDAGKSSLLVKGRNNAAKRASSLPTGVVDALAGTTRVQVQLRTSDEECFGVTLHDITEKAGLLKAK